MFIVSLTNFFLTGQMSSLRMYSMVKKMMTKLSMRWMMATMIGKSLFPSSSSCSSSMVASTKVMVDTSTIDKEKKATNWASLIRNKNFFFVLLSLARPRVFEGVPSPRAPLTKLKRVQFRDQQINTNMYPTIAKVLLCSKFEFLLLCSDVTIFLTLTHVNLRVVPTNHCQHSCHFKLRCESSTLILYKELSSTIFQSLSVSQASVTPVQISTFCNI